MLSEAILLSVRPRWAERILNGTKSVELRRVLPNVRPGQLALVYSSSPTMALVGSASVERVETGQPRGLWRSVRLAAGVTYEEYCAYFDQATAAVAIWLRDVQSFDPPLGLSELRKRWPWFRPPQSYCFIGVDLSEEGRVGSIRPRERDRFELTTELPSRECINHVE